MDFKAKCKRYDNLVIKLKKNFDLIKENPNPPFYKKYFYNRTINETKLLIHEAITLHNQIILFLSTISDLCTQQQIDTMIGPYNVSMDELTELAKKYL